MPLFQSTRKILSAACFSLSVVWAAAGVFKLVFGIRITLSLLPPLGLERVALLPAFAVAGGLMVVGAWLGRTSREAGPREDLDVPVRDPQLIPVDVVAPAAPALRQETIPVGRRPPSA